MIKRNTIINGVISQRRIVRVLSSVLTVVLVLTLFASISGHAYAANGDSVAAAIQTENSISLLSVSGGGNLQGNAGDEEHTISLMVRENFQVVLVFLLIVLAMLVFLTVSLYRSKKKLAMTRFVDRKLMEKYDAVFIVYLNQNTIKTVKSSRVSEYGRFSGVKNYRKLALKFSEIVAPKYRQDWKNFSSTEYLKIYMSRHKTREFIYELPGTANSLRRLTIDVLDRLNGEASSLLFSFVGIDDISAKTMMLKNQLAEQNSFTRYFLEPYIAAFYVDLDDNSWQTSKSSDSSAELSARPDNYLESIEDFSNSEVYPDDRENFSVLYHPDEIIKRLSAHQSFSFTFRPISRAKDMTVQCEVARGADENHIAIGFKDISEVVKKQRDDEVTADLAKQQRSIKAFGDMVNAALWGMTVDNDNRVADVRWSDEAKRMLGFELSDDDFPKNLNELASRIHPEDRERVNEHFKKIIRSRNDKAFVYDIEYRILKKSGEYCWYHVSGRMEYINIDTRSIYGIIYDISTEKQLEEALEEAQTANRAKTSFLFNMSHDIRTPLNAILGFTDMAEKNTDSPEKLEECLTKIKQAGNLLLSLINSVLEMSRIESGKAELAEKPGAVEYSFASIESTMQELAKKKNIDLSFEYGEITDNYVFADVDRANRVFINIISNAIKYTNNGGRVKVKCCQIGRPDDEHGLYRYTVEDNGIGMSEEFQKNLFDEFSRENNSTVSGIQGSGLGLSVAKSFVELMHGTIECRSKKGEGTVFTITLPLRLQKDITCISYIDPITHEDIRVESGSDNDNQNVLGGKRVLLVEDNELNREIATFVLEDENMIVEQADDGSTAVQMLRDKGPDYYDVILMDIQMPVMNGYDATREIRNMYPNAKLPIIALSANAFAEDKAAAVASGMNDHIAKPINAGELYGVMSKYLS